MGHRRTRGCLQESSVSTLLGSARAKAAWKSDEDKNRLKGKCSLQVRKQKAAMKRRRSNCVQRKEWSCSGLLVGSFRSQTCSPVCIRKVHLQCTPGALSWVLQLFSDTHDGWYSQATEPHNFPTTSKCQEMLMSKSLFWRLRLPWSWATEDSSRFGSVKQPRGGSGWTCRISVACNHLVYYLPGLHLTHLE